VALAEPAPLFSIGEGVCSSVATNEASIDAPAADAVFAGDSLAAEGESDPPVISNFVGQDQGGGNWLMTGTVTDDGPVEGLPVYINFNGMYQGVVYAAADGSFSYSLSIGNDYGIVDATAYDADGMNSEAAMYYVSSTAEPPEIHNFVGYDSGGGMWVFSGYVTDDESVEGLSVFIDFNGISQGTATTDANGYFSLAFYIAAEDWGLVNAVAYDLDNMASDAASYYVS
jgi:hypothetical protein